MKLFGKKDKNAAAPEIAADDLGDVDTGFEEMEGASAPSQPLSAPSRSIGASAGGSRKNLMVLGLLAVVPNCWLIPRHVSARKIPAARRSCAALSPATS